VALFVVYEYICIILDVKNNYTELHLSVGIHIISSVLDAIYAIKWLYIGFDKKIYRQEVWWDRGTYECVVSRSVWYNNT